MYEIKLDDGNTSKPLTTSTTLFLGIIFSSLLFLLMSSIIFVFGEFSKWLQDIMLVLAGASSFFLFFGCLTIVPVSEIGIVTFLGKPIKKFHFAEGVHWTPIQLDKFLNKFRIHNETYIIDGVSSINKVLMYFKISIQWHNINPYQNLKYSYEECKKRISNIMRKSIVELIIREELTDIKLLNETEKLSEIIFANLLVVSNQFGDELIDVTIETVKPVNVERLKFFENQSELDSYLEQMTNMSISQKITPEEAFRIIAIKEGWIKSNESIYKIKGFESIIDGIVDRLHRNR